MDIFIGMHRAYTINACDRLQATYQECAKKCIENLGADNDVYKCKRKCYDVYFVESHITKCAITPPKIVQDDKHN